MYDLSWLLDGAGSHWASSLLQVVVIDLTLAGDNAVVIGLAAAGLAAKDRARAIAIGIAAATVLRIVFALFTTQLLQIVGLLLAGGILLLWVAWKMWRELSAAHMTPACTDDGVLAPALPAPKTLRQASVQIVVADISMSLDNVLAVAGAAMHHVEVLIFGLAFSVVLMGVAATLLARLLQKHRWIGFLGLVMVLAVAVEMIYEGGHEVWAESEILRSSIGAR